MKRSTEHPFGEKFGRLTVVRLGKYRSHHYHYICRCDCGSVTEVSRGNLLRGTSQSCGCLRHELHLERSTNHGCAKRSKSLEYRAWVGMKTRCYNENEPSYKHYGGRGIKVCKRWLSSFEAFLEDMGPKPQGCSVERLNVDGDYEPGNCVWATDKEQGNNKRSNVVIEYEGQRFTMATLTEHLGLNYCRFKYFYRRRRLPLDVAIAQTRALGVIRGN